MLNLEFQMLALLCAKDFMLSIKQYRGPSKMSWTAQDETDLMTIEKAIQQLKTYREANQC